jgi:putative transposase
MQSRQGTFNELYYHFIWTTKGRTPIIDSEIENVIKKVLHSKAIELRLEILEVNGTEDHLHLLIRSIPSLAPSDIAKHFKGSSSHFVNHITLKGDNTRALYWQDGYGVVTVSSSAVKTIKKYIKNQKEHHEKNKLCKELENCEYRF